jgi:hypothetical protein
MSRGALMQYYNVYTYNAKDIEYIKQYFRWKLNKLKNI